MEEKKIGIKEEQPVVEKKVYTPPTLTVYGKLTELTAAGTANTPETATPKDPTDPNRKT